MLCKHFGTRLISLLIAVIMVFTVMPLQAFADDTVDPAAENSSSNPESGVEADDKNSSLPSMADNGEENGTGTEAGSKQDGTEPEASGETAEKTGEKDDAEGAEGKTEPENPESAENKAEPENPVAAGEPENPLVKPVGEEENASAKLTLKWLEGSSVSNIEDDTLDMTPATNGHTSAKYELEFTMGNADAEAKEVKIRIPKFIFFKRDGKGAELPSLWPSYILGIPEAPAEGDQTAFHYYEDGGDIVITNFKKIEAAYKFTCEITYYFIPMDVKDGFINSDIKATAAFDGKELAESNSLEVCVHTDSKLGAASKIVLGKYDEWQENWNTKESGKPSDADDYFYVVYSYSVKLAGSNNTQPFEIKITEDPQDGGTVAGWWPLLTIDYNPTKVDNATDYALTQGNSFSNTITNKTSYGYYGYCYQAILIKYPKAGAAVGKEYKNEIKFELVGTDDAKDEKVASAKYIYENIESKYSGDEFYFKKGIANNITYRGGLNMLENNGTLETTWPITVINTNLNISENGTKPYTIEVTDGTVKWVGKTLDAGEDYELTAFRINSITEYSYKVNPSTGEYVDIASKDYDNFKPITIWTQAAGTTVWEKFGTVSATSSATPAKNGFEYIFKGEDGTEEKLNASTSSKSNIIKLPEGTCHVRAAYEGTAYKVALSFNVIAAIKPTAKVKGTFTDTTTSVTISNTAEMKVFDSNDTEKSSLKSTAFAYAERLKRESAIEKTLYSSSSDTANGREVQQFTIRQYERVWYQQVTKEDVIAAGAIPDQQQATFYDLLPHGSIPDIDNIEVTTHDNSLKVDFEVETKDNWRDSGQTMMIVRIIGIEGGKPNYTPDPDADVNTIKSIYSGFTVKYKLFYPWENIQAYGVNYKNSVAYISPHELAGGRNDDGGGITNKEYLKELNDYSNAAANKKSAMYAEISIKLNPHTASELGLVKTVKAQGDTSWGKTANAQYAEAYSYRLRFTSNNASKTSGIVIYDALESAGNLFSSWKGTLKGYDISQPLSRGIDVKVYYSTLPAVDPKTQNNLTDTGVWSVITPTTDLSKVTALAFDLSEGKDGKPFVLGEKEVLHVIIEMQAPADSQALAAHNKAYIKAVSESGSLFAEECTTVNVFLPYASAEISKTSIPPSGTQASPAVVKTGDSIDYTLKIKNTTGESKEITNIKIEDAVPAGLEIDYDNITYYWGDNEAYAMPVKGSSEIQSNYQNQQLSFVICSLPDGETVSIVIPTKVETQANPGTEFLNSAQITSMLGKHVDIKSETTYHKLPGPVSSLTVKKSVEGTGADLTKEFAFTVTLKDSAGNALPDSYSYTGSKSGVLKSGDSILLRHGEAVTISGLPNGAKYEVSENDYSALGYTAAVTGGSGTLSALNPATASFVNSYTAPVTPPPVTPPEKPDPPEKPKTDGGTDKPDTDRKPPTKKIIGDGTPLGKPDIILDDEIPKAKLPKTGGNNKKAKDLNSQLYYRRKENEESDS